MLHSQHPDKAGPAAAPTDCDGLWAALKKARAAAQGQLHLLGPQFAALEQKRQEAERKIARVLQKLGGKLRLRQGGGLCYEWRAATTLGGDAVEQAPTFVMTGADGEVEVRGRRPRAAWRQPGPAPAAMCVALQLVGALPRALACSGAMLCTQVAY